MLPAERAAGSDRLYGLCHAAGVTDPGLLEECAFDVLVMENHELPLVSVTARIRTGSLLEPADIWCAKVLNWPELMAHDGFKVLDMLQTVTRADDVSIETTRSPLRTARIDGASPRSGTRR